MSFKEELTRKTRETEQLLKQFLPKEEGFEKVLTIPMNYSLMAGGKRLRPILMKETFRFFGGEGEEINYLAVAMEMVHTSSLVHDDLPAIDNDEFRRGKKTTHAEYGEDMAILAGDGLLNYAYEVAVKGMALAADPRLYAKALEVFANKAGVYGMLGGQTLDVSLTGKKFDGDTLLFIHKRKTAALIEASLMCPAILSGASEHDVAVMEKIGSKVGLAFQIRDDILDETGNAKELGKPVKSDEKNQKTTYITEFGMEKACQDVDEMSKSAVELLHSLDGKNDFLEELIISLVSRKR